MKRTYVVALVVLLVSAACSSDPAEEPSVNSSPTAAVSAWLAAVTNLDLDAMDQLTDPENVGLMAAAENGFTSGQLAAVAGTGMPGPTAESYWATFRDGMTTFLGAPPDSLIVGETETFTYDGTEFAVVTVGTGESTTGIVTQSTEDGWIVDMVATTGPALAVQIRRLLAAFNEEEQSDDEDSDDEDPGDARVFATIAVTSLGAALSRDDNNRALDLEVEAIEDLHMHD